MRVAAAVQRRRDQGPPAAQRAERELAPPDRLQGRHGHHRAAHAGAVPAVQRRAQHDRQDLPDDDHAEARRPAHAAARGGVHAGAASDDQDRDALPQPRRDGRPGHRHGDVLRRRSGGDQGRGQHPVHRLARYRARAEQDDGGPRVLQPGPGDARPDEREVLRDHRAHPQARPQRRGRHRRAADQPAHAGLRAERVPVERARDHDAQARVHGRSRGRLRLHVPLLQQHREHGDVRRVGQRRDVLLLGYYYPSNGAHVCAHATYKGFGVDLCCPDAGPQLCSLLDGKK